MRITLSFFSAVLITLALFYIMIGLVRTDKQPNIDVMEPTFVEIENRQESDQSSSKGEDDSKAPSSEPLPKLDIRRLVSQNHSTKNADIPMQLDVPVAETLDIPVNTLNQNWIQPTPIDQSANASSRLEGDIVLEQESIRKVIPVGTRMPNVPKIAWDNKINGWVRLSFTVTSEGKVKDVRVLDAFPRGVFEENAVVAVKKWRYRGFIGHDRYVTQKIEFEWKNYPYNLDY